MTEITSHRFKKNAAAALHNAALQRALGNIQLGFVEKRRLAINRLPEFDQLRDHAKQIKDHTLINLDYYLQEYEKKVIASGGTVHWALDAKEACDIAIKISQSVNAKLITKGKSMVSEEIGLNQALSHAGFSVVETDLGEYIIQLRHEAPSHIVAPAIHVLKEQVSEDFRRAHLQYDPARDLTQPQQLLSEARAILREKFLKADVGITGANCLIAENGASVIVTNEGNGDLTQTCASVHIVIASLEKVVPTVEDAMTILRLLPRSATGQEITSYVTFSIGPKRTGDLDGPKQYHVILVDNQRSQMLGTHYQDMLRCIRCGACLNHCPVYNAVGGQAYGSVYPGPMGAVLTPSLFGIAASNELPNASTLCGRCEEVCPMRIPLPSMMRSYRELEFKKHLSPFSVRTGLKTWAFFAKRPRLYHYLMSTVSGLLRWLGKKRGRLNTLPFAKGWTAYRDFPVPSDKTFHALWNDHRKEIS
jgi:L-lactate dehydrogenase complex protein LldF